MNRQPANGDESFSRDEVLPCKPARREGTARCAPCADHRCGSARSGSAPRPSSRASRERSPTPPASVSSCPCEADSPAAHGGAMPASAAWVSIASSSRSSRAHRSRVRRAAARLRAPTTIDRSMMAIHRVLEAVSSGIQRYRIRLVRRQADSASRRDVPVACCHAISKGRSRASRRISRTTAGPWSRMVRATNACDPA